MSLTVCEEHSLIARARQGDSTAFEDLYGAYEKQVYAFIKARTFFDDGAAQEIAQDTRIHIWAEKLSEYDPGRKGFLAFAKFWAHIMLHRYYKAAQQRAKVETLAMEFQRRYPGQEQELGDVLAYLGAQASPSVEETLLLEEDAEREPEMFEELARITFGGSSPPHQLIALGFHVLPAPAAPQEAPRKRRDRAVPSPWPPRRIVAELSDTLLKPLEATLEHEHVRTSELPEERVRSHFEPLRNNMDGLVGTTTFRHYYTHPNNPTQDISHWCEAVQRRVWDDVREHRNARLLTLLEEAERRKREAKRRRARQDEGVGEEPGL